MAKDHIHANITPLVKQFDALRKEITDLKVQKRIHRAAGNEIKKEMVGNIVDARETIRIRRGKQSPLDIKPGTMRRSIKVWLIDKQHSTYWVGPRVGRRAPKDADAWFANIVEGGDQRFGGNKQKGVFFDSITQAAPKAFQLMRKKYDFQIRKVARKKNKK